MCAAVLPRVILEADVVDIPLAKIIKEVFQGRKKDSSNLRKEHLAQETE